MSPSEAQAVVIDWVKATEEFHRRYFQINEVINKLTRSKRTVSSTDKERSVRVKNLLRIRQQMNDVLTTLLGDMADCKPGRHKAAPSKPGQLMAHTKLLRELTREIDAELSRTTGAHA